MAKLHPLFQVMIDAAFPALNRPPVVEPEYVECESCGEPSTHTELNPGDPSVGFGPKWIELCDECGRRR
jgi:hypothetical protein